jgi:hypothetical protein
VPEESSADGAESEPGRPDTPVPAFPVPRPPRPRRTLLIGFGAGIGIAALIAVIVVVIMRPGAQAQGYTVMPAPCALISGTHLATYVPDATGTQRSVPSSSTHQTAACYWETISGREDLSLSVQVDIYSSAPGVTLAAQTFRQARYSVSCPRCPKGIRAEQTAEPVSGLGNQSTAWVVTIGSGAGAARWVYLVVRSENADVYLQYSIDPIVGTAQPPPGGTALLADAAAMARDVLASLASPAKTASPGVANSSPAVAAPTAPPGPRYGKPADPCKLVTTATLAKYLPGAAELPAPGATPSAISGLAQMGNCGWGTPDGITLSTNYDLYGSGMGSLDARDGYAFDVQFDGQGSAPGNIHTKINGTRPVAGVGAQATAIFKTQTMPSIGDSATSQVVQLLAWSGNVQIGVEISYQNMTLPGAAPSSPPSHAAQIAAVTAIARDMLAAMPKA